MKILVVGDPHGNLPKDIPKKNIDLIICTGDLGKADLARKRFFENVERKKKDLPELKNDSAFEKKVWNEIHFSTINVLKKLSKIAPTYSLLGNVGTSMYKDSFVKKEEKKHGLKLPFMRREIKKIQNVSIVQNRLRNFNGLRVGFLEHYLDISWVKEFKPKDFEKQMKKAKKETTKAKKNLENFGKIDILVCHAPPYGILDAVNFPGAPKDWQGKHAGGKTILDYIRKYKPEYVLCGHIHEGQGEARIGKTHVYNLGFNGNFKVLEI